MHPEFVGNNSNDDNNDNKRYKRSVSEERGNLEACVGKMIQFDIL